MVDPIVPGIVVESLHAATPAVVCKIWPDVPAVVIVFAATQAGLPPVVSSLCPDVPKAIQVGTPRLEAAMIAPPVGISQRGPMLVFAVLYANMAPLVGAAKTVVTPADDTTNICPELPTIQAGAEVPLLYDRIALLDGGFRNVELPLLAA